MNRSHLICLDLDNTLVYATKTHLLAFQEAFRKNKLPRRTNKELHKHFGLSSAETIRKLYPSLSEKQLKKVAQDHENLVLNKTYVHTAPIRGVHECLKKLRKCGYKLAIVTNCKKRVLLRIMAAAKISRKLFSVLVYSNKVLRPKPAPDEIYKAEHLSRMKADYMVGDTVYDITAAHKAGVRAIAVCTGTESHSQLARKKPEAILKSVADLPKWLEKR